MRFRSLITLLILIGMAFAFASSDEEKTDAVVSIYTEVAQVESFVIACNQRFPNTRLPNEAAFAEWKTRNGLQEFDQVLAALAQKSPALITQMQDTIRGKYLKVILKQNDAKLEPTCQAFPDLLKWPDSNQIKTDRAKELTIISEMARGFKNTPASTSSSTGPSTGPSTGSSGNAAAGTLYTIGQLNTLTNTLFANATGNSFDKDKAVTKKLQALGTIYVKGTVLGRSDRLVYFGLQQGNKRSRIQISFFMPEDANGKTISESQGRELILAADLASFNRFDDQDSLYFYRPIVVSETSSLKGSTLPDKLEWVRKPIAATEVMTKPGKGLKPEQIQGMYNYEKQTQRLDGNSNIYYDTQTSNLLVLRDGSTYRYFWNFPPEDLNVAVSRREEPKKWGRWDAKKYSEYTKLLPVPKGMTLNRGYSLTRLGQGTALSKSAIGFDNKGRFTTYSFKMVAGFSTPGNSTDVSVIGGSGTTGISDNGSGQTSSTSVSEGSESSAAYLLSGYALTLTRDDGSVSRTWIGIPEYCNKTNPGWIVLNGSFWFGSGKKC